MKRYILLSKSMRSTAVTQWQAFVPVESCRILELPSERRPFGDRGAGPPSRHGAGLGRRGQAPRAGRGPRRGPRPALCESAAQRSAGMRPATQRPSPPSARPGAPRPTPRIAPDTRRRAGPRKDTGARGCGCAGPVSDSERAPHRPRRQTPRRNPSAAWRSLPRPRGPSAEGELRRKARPLVRRPSRAEHSVRHSAPAPLGRGPVQVCKTSWTLGSDLVPGRPAHLQAPRELHRPTRTGGPEWLLPFCSSPWIGQVDGPGLLAPPTDQQQHREPPPPPPPPPRGRAAAGRPSQDRGRGSEACRNRAGDGRRRTRP